MKSKQKKKVRVEKEEKKEKPTQELLKHLYDRLAAKMVVALYQERDRIVSEL